MSRMRTSWGPPEGEGGHITWGPSVARFPHALPPHLGRGGGGKDACRASGTSVVSHCRLSRRGRERRGCGGGLDDMYHSQCWRLAWVTVACQDAYTVPPLEPHPRTSLLPLPRRLSSLHFPPASSRIRPRETSTDTIPIPAKCDPSPWKAPKARAPILRPFLPPTKSKPTTAAQRCVRKNHPSPLPLPGA